MDEHLAACPTCHEVYAETLRFALDEEAEEALPRSSLVAIPFVRRPAFRVAAVLAVAASVFLAFQQLWHARSERPAAPLVAELAQAMGTKRFVEPRLTGGFRHGRLIVLRSSAAPQGLDAQSPAVLAAVARIRERTEGDTSPDGLGALAVTYLVSGDITKAVKALESATAQAPKNPRLQSDLAAAYLVRASRLDEPADLPKALEAAEKAIELEDAPDEAWFNRGLALEQLHLVDSAKKAWEDFLKRDSTSAWADEARRHIDELPPAQQSTIEEDRARARAAVAEGQAAIDRLADEAPSILADYFLTELLPTWADAQLTGHPSALVLREQARQAGEALFRTRTTLPRRRPRPRIAPIGRVPRPPEPRPSATRPSEAQRLRDLLRPSCDSFREAQSLLEAGGLFGLGARADRRRLPLPGRAAGGGCRAQPNRALAERRGYALLWRVHWMQGLLLANRGEFTDLSIGIDSPARASALRDRRAGERSGRLATVLEVVGDRDAAWRERLGGLVLFDRVREPSRRYAVLTEAARACLLGQLSRAALHVQTAAVEAARRWSRPAVISDSLISRSASSGPRRR
jgi:tetratricopeptide (TPR) repeat protein